jgi:hypothetical protein
VAGDLSSAAADCVAQAPKVRMMVATRAFMIASPALSGILQRILGLIVDGDCCATI